MPANPPPRWEPTADILARWPDPLAALSTVERERSGALRAPDDFVAAHLLARECVGDLLGMPAGEVRLAQRCVECGGPHGLPSVVGEPSVGVSWSHSHGYVAALAADRPVGVDIELRTGRPLRPRMVDRMATAREAAAIRAADDPALAFLRMWVVKESLVKVGALTLAGFVAADVGVPWPGYALAVVEHPEVVLGTAVRTG